MAKSQHSPRTSLWFPTISLIMVSDIVWGCFVLFQFSGMEKSTASCSENGLKSEMEQCVKCQHSPSSDGLAGSRTVWEAEALVQMLCRGGSQAMIATCWVWYCNCRAGSGAGARGEEWVWAVQEHMQSSVSSWSAGGKDNCYHNYSKIIHMLNIIKNMDNLSPWLRSGKGTANKAAGAPDWLNRFCIKNLHATFHAYFLSELFSCTVCFVLACCPHSLTPTLCMNSKCTSSLGEEESPGALTYPAFRVDHVSVWLAGVNYCLTSYSNRQTLCQ